MHTAIACIHKNNRDMNLSYQTPPFNFDMNTGTHVKCGQLDMGSRTNLKGPTDKFMQLSDNKEKEENSVMNPPHKSILQTLL